MFNYRFWIMKYYNDDESMCNIKLINSMKEYVFNKSIITPIANILKEIF